VVDPPLEIIRSTTAWYHTKLSRRFKESAALKARGFVVGARETLTRDWNTAAGSEVIEFKTSRGARAMLGQTMADLRSGSYARKRLAVPGIPGAQGAAFSSALSKGFNIAFADGRFWYRLTVLYPRNATRPTLRISAISAAQALYRRVHSP
jgi:hypothetical protein